MEPHQRFSDSDVETWRREGVALLRDFFTKDEVEAVCADFEKVLARNAGADQPLNRKNANEIGRFDGAQFKTFEAIPFDCSRALNLIGVHPSVIAFARAALEVDAVQLYQYPRNRSNLLRWGG